MQRDLEYSPFYSNSYWRPFLCVKFVHFDNSGTNNIKAEIDFQIRMHLMIEKKINKRRVK